MSVPSKENIRLTKKTYDNCMFQRRFIVGFCVIFLMEALTVLSIVS